MNLRDATLVASNGEVKDALADIVRVMNDIAFQTNIPCRANCHGIDVIAAQKRCEPGQGVRLA